MPGLLQPDPNAAQQPAAAATLPPAAAGATATEESGNVSAEEQAEYDAFVTNGMKMLYDEKALPQLVESMKGDGNPVQGLADALVMLVTRVEDSAEQQGKKISGDVLMHGGTELLEQMVELSEQAGIHEFDEKDMESALFLAMDQYREARQEQGKLPVDQLKADMQELQGADADGRIEEVLPGITEYANNAPKPDDTPQRGG